MKSVTRILKIVGFNTIMVSVIIFRDRVSAPPGDAPLVRRKLRNATPDGI